jgi:hypothetical protein
MSDVNEGDLRADWKEHPYTGVMRRRMEHEMVMKRAKVDTACRQSTDPKVRAAIAELDEAQLIMNLWTEGVK